MLNINVQIKKIKIYIKAHKSCNKCYETLQCKENV